MPSRGRPPIPPPHEFGRAGPNSLRRSVSQMAKSTSHSPSLDRDASHRNGNRSRSRSRSMSRSVAISRSRSRSRSRSPGSRWHRGRTFSRTSSPNDSPPKSSKVCTLTLTLVFRFSFLPLTVPGYIMPCATLLFSLPIVSLMLLKSRLWLKN